MFPLYTLSESFQQYDRFLLMSFTAETRVLSIDSDIQDLSLQTAFDTNNATITAVTLQEPLTYLQVRVIL